MTSPTSRRLEIEFTGDTSDVQRAVRRVQGTVRRAVAGMNQLQATIRINANTNPAQRQMLRWRRQQEANPLNIRVQTDLRNIRQVSQSILQLTRGFNLLGLVVGGLSTLTFLVGAATAVTAMATSLGFALVSLTAMLPAALGLAAAFTAVALAADRIKESEGWRRLQADIESLRDVAGDELVPAFNEFYRQAERNFPLLQTHIQNLASSIGDALVDVGEFLGSELAGDQLANIFGFNESAIAALARSFRPLTGIILSLAEASAPLFERFALALESALVRFDAFLLRTRETGELAEFFQQTGDEMAKWGRIFRNVFTGMGNLIGAALGPSREWASAFERITAQFRVWSDQEDTHRSIERFFTFMKDLPYGDILQVIAAITAMIIVFKGVQGITTIVSGFAGFIGAILAAGPILGPILAVLGAIAVALGLVAGGFVIAYTESERFRERANQAFSNVLGIAQEFGRDFSDIFGIVKDAWENWSQSDAGDNALRILQGSFNTARESAARLFETIQDHIDDFKRRLENAKPLLDAIFGSFTDVLTAVNDGITDINNALSILITAVAPAESNFNLLNLALGAFKIALDIAAVSIRTFFTLIAAQIQVLALVVLAIQEAGEWFIYLGKIISDPLSARFLEPPWKNGWLTGLDEVQEKIREITSGENPASIPSLNDALSSTQEAGAAGAGGLTEFANQGTILKQQVEDLRTTYQQAFGEDIPQSFNDALTEIEGRATAHEAFLNEIFKYEAVKQGVADLRAAIEAAGLEIAPEWEQAFQDIESAAETAKTNVNNNFTQMQSGSRTANDGIRLDAGQTRQVIEREMADARRAAEAAASGSSNAWRGGGGAFGQIQGGANGMREAVGGSFGAMRTNAASQAIQAAASVVAALSGIRINAPSISFQGIINAAYSAAAQVRSILGGLAGLFGFGRALGGPVEPPRWAKRAALGAGRAGAYWVGEHGPELFIPNQPGRVVNSSASNRIASESAPVEVNVILTGLPDAFAEYVDVQVTQGQRDQRRFDDAGSSIGGW